MNLASTVLRSYQKKTKNMANVLRGCAHSSDSERLCQGGSLTRFLSNSLEVRINTQHTHTVRLFQPAVSIVGQPRACSELSNMTKAKIHQAFTWPRPDASGPPQCEMPPHTHTRARGVKAHFYAQLSCSCVRVHPLRNNRGVKTSMLVSKQTLEQGPRK